MTKKDAKTRINELIREINYHNDLYYNRDEPVITDSEYDALLSELIELEDEYPDLKKEDSPTQRIGGQPLEKFEQFEHPYKMLGLSNITNFNELEKFHERMTKDLANKSFNYSLEYKLDGLAIELIYIDGYLNIASTRGDGVVGENITENVKTIRNIPLKLNKPISGRIIVRGEAVIHKSDFEYLNKKREDEGEKLFANPRNAAAGTLRQLDSKIVAKRPINFYAYQLISDSNDIKIKSHNKSMNWLKQAGFDIVSGTWLLDNLEKIQEIYEKIQEQRDSLEYEIDGLVVKIDELDLHEKLGEIARSPRWAVAYKFKELQVTTILKDIKLQISRHGVLTPVAVVKPVKIGGVTVSKVTLHNKSEIERLNVMLGDKVRLKRAGDVIPKITGVDKSQRTGNEKKYQFPEKCPFCSTKIKNDKNGVFVYCPNTSCPDRKIEEIKYFISKPCFNMEGIGSEWIRDLFEKELINDAADLFTLKKEELLKLDRMGEKSSENFIKSIQNSKTIKYKNFLTSLGIKFVGASIADILTGFFKTFEDLTKAKIDELEEINEIGPNIAKSITDYFTDINNINFIEKLFENGVEIRYDKGEVKSNVLNGQTFLFTGSLSAFKRDEAKEIVIKNGGKNLASVSKNLDYLVVGENPGSKKDKALKNNVKIISEEEFLNMVNKT